MQDRSGNFSDKYSELDDDLNHIQFEKFSRRDKAYKSNNVAVGGKGGKKKWKPRQNTRDDSELY